MVADDLSNAREREIVSDYFLQEFGNDLEEETVILAVIIRVR